MQSSKNAQNTFITLLMTVTSNISSHFRGMKLPELEEEL